MSSAAELGLQVFDMAVDGQRWRIAQRPAVTGPSLPLVLCNGIGVNWQVFLPLIAALGAHPVIAFDTPGVGASPAPAGRYPMSGLATQVQSLLHAVDIERFHVLGVSWGGALAQQIALQAQLQCQRLVLAATSTGALSFPGRLEALLQLADARRFSGDARALRALGSAYGGRVERDEAALRDYLQLVVPPSEAGYKYQLGAIAGWTSLPWLPLLRQPTLILAGREDPLVPVANARLMHWLVRHSTLEVVDDGHLFLHTRAAELGPRIVSFLNG